jgi:hypothetical protein
LPASIALNPKYAAVTPLTATTYTVAMSAISPAASLYPAHDAKDRQRVEDHAGQSKPSHSALRIALCVRVFHLAAAVLQHDLPLFGINLAVAVKIIFAWSYHHLTRNRQAKPGRPTTSHERKAVTRVIVISQLFDLSAAMICGLLALANLRLDPQQLLPATLPVGVLDMCL